MTILLQCKLQLAKQFLARHLGVERAAAFHPASLTRLKMKAFVQPGDDVETILRLVSENDNQFMFKFVSEVRGKRVCVGEAELVKVAYD